MKIKTSALQELLNKVSKGVGNNKLFVVTQYITIKCTPTDITLLSTDGNNYLYVKESMQCDNFTATVKADTFCALVSKMTCDEIELILKDGILNVSGDGDYQIGTLDEAGVTKIVNPFIDIDFSDIIKVNTKELKKYLNIAKPSLAISLEQPCYTGYYISDKLIATDTFQVTSIDKNLFNNNVLMYATTAELLNLMTADEINVSIAENGLKFDGDNIIIYTKELSGKDDYQVDAIISLTDVKFRNKCVLNKERLISALNRLSLFVDIFDKNAINMQFTKDALILSTKGTNGKEVIKYDDFDVQDDEYKCLIDIKLLQAQLNVVDADSIELYYRDNSETVIKISNNETTQLIALMIEKPL